MRLASPLRLGLKLGLTVAVFGLMLHHPISLDGVTISVWEALRQKLHALHWAQALPWLLAAMGLKGLGIVAAMARWHLLLLAQGMAFSRRHIAGSFLIGRFLGTFLPGTLGLDAYKLYDATHYGRRQAEPMAATAAEKLLGLCGMGLTYLLSAPLGYTVLGPWARWVLCLTVPTGIAGCGLVFLSLWRPGWLLQLAGALGPVLRPRWGAALQAFARGVASYRGKTRLLLVCAGLSLLVHASTAVVYYFTARAIGAEGASWGEVVFASSIQIFATVFSPFTLAGEGVRELVQALLLGKRIGTTASILSASLGFWAAEAPTLLGGLVWLRRSPSYWPAYRFVAPSPAPAAPAGPSLALREAL